MVEKKIIYKFLKYHCSLIHVIVHFHSRLFSLAWVRLLMFCNSHLRLDVFGNETAEPLLSFICQNRLLSPILCLPRLSQPSTQVWSITQHIRSAISDHFSVILRIRDAESRYAHTKRRWKIHSLLRCVSNTLLISLSELFLSIESSTGEFSSYSGAIL